MLTRGLRRFGEFELNPVNHVLIGNGEVIKLAPQPFKILTVLTERPARSLRERRFGTPSGAMKPSSISNTASTRASRRSTCARRRCRRPALH